MITQYKTAIDKLNIRHETANRRVQDEETMLEKNRKETENTESAQSIIQTVAKTIQEQVHDQIASVVSKCLEAIFDEPYDFRIVFERKRGKTEARLVFCRNGLEVDPMTASGGGVVDVAAFALRLACLALSQPQRRRLVVLDEPFKFLSAQYRPRVREMLSSLAEEMEIQFIMVTHIEELVMGTVVRTGE